MGVPVFIPHRGTATGKYFSHQLQHERTSVCLLIAEILIVCELRRGLSFTKPKTPLGRGLSFRKPKTPRVNAFNIDETLKQSNNT